LSYFASAPTSSTALENEWKYDGPDPTPILYARIGSARQMLGQLKPRDGSPGHSLRVLKTVKTRIHFGPAGTSLPAYLA
jgi:hypothetical protein